MNQFVLIRAAALTDLPHLLKLANQLSETIQVSEQYLGEYLGTLLEDKRHCLLVATQEEVVVGYVSGYFHRAIYASGLVAYIDELVVDASHRGLSIGTQLMHQFEQMSQDKACQLVSLATFGAKDFYEKLGYRSKAGYFKKYLS